jgi:hypothetical protein
MDAALRAKSLAVFLAECPAGQAKQHLFAHGVLQQKTALFIIPDFGLIFRNCSLSGLIIDTAGAKNEVEAARKRLTDGVQAPRAELLELSGEAGAEANVVDEVLGPRCSTISSAWPLRLKGPSWVMSGA